MEERRRGKITVQRELLLNYEAAARIMHDVVVWHTEANLMSDTLTIYAEHRKFDLVSVAVEAPEYEAVVTDKSVEWRRVAAQSS